jgi:membrane fusion protein, multidrug efflux system
MLRTRSRSFRRLLFIALVLLALVLVWKARNYQRRYTAAEARKASRPIPVSASHAKVSELETSVGAAGQVLQYKTVTLTSRIAAKIDKVLVNVGDTIQSGAVLVEDEKAPFEAALDSARAEFESARVAEQKAAAELKSMEALKAKKMATELEVNDARVTLASKQAALQEANVKLIKAQLDFEATRLTSPVNGIVLARFVNSDERVEVNQVLLQLGDLEKVYLLAQVQDESVSQIHEGQPAEVFFSAYPTTTFKGTIEHVDPRVDPKTRAFTAYVTIHNPTLKLKPGLTGFMRARLEKTALAVPTAAVINPFGENASVFAIDSNGRAVLTPVRVGLEAGGMIEIVSGLKEGTLVATAGTVDLVNHDRVRVESSQ